MLDLCGLFFIDRVRIEAEITLHELERSRVFAALQIHRAVEAGAAPSVAGPGTDLLDIEDKGVLVTVRADLDDFLDVARGGSLVPQFLPAAGIINGLPQFKGLEQRFLIHVGEHQGLPGGGIHGHGGHQPVGVELGRKCRTFLDGPLVSAAAQADAGIGFGALMFHACGLARSRHVSSPARGNFGQKYGGET